jgi:hypothetical protein
MIFDAGEDVATISGGREICQNAESAKATRSSGKFRYDELARIFCLTPPERRPAPGSGGRETESGTASAAGAGAEGAGNTGIAGLMGVGSSRSGPSVGFGGGGTGGLQSGPQARSARRASRRTRGDGSTGQPVFSSTLNPSSQSFSRIFVVQQFPALQTRHGFPAAS